MPNPPKPIELKRLLGNPGQRPLPDPATVTLLPGASEPPVPARTLDEAGLGLWRTVWTAGAVWLAANVDCEHILRMCERADEHAALRVKVLRDGDRFERAALRVLDDQIRRDLSALGFTPTDRARMGVAEVRPVSRIEQLIAAKKQHPA